MRAGAHVELEGWATVEEMLEDFRAPKDALDDAVVVIGVYDRGDWEGSATVYFQHDDGSWSEVYASHCSCYGLEDQWQPTPFDPVAGVKAIPRYRSPNFAEAAVVRFLGGGAG